MLQAVFVSPCALANDSRCHEVPSDLTENYSIPFLLGFLGPLSRQAGSQIVYLHCVITEGHVGVVVKDINDSPFLPSMKPPLYRRAVS
jgi:hypothetical protein